MATGIDSYGGTKLQVTSAVAQAGVCVVCGLPNNHPAAPPSGSGTEETYVFTRTAVAVNGSDATYLAHPTCWRNFHANQPFAVYLP